MSKTQRISENQQCLADFLLDVQAENRAAGTLQFYRQKLDAIAPETVAALLDTCDATEKGRRDRAIFLALLDSGLRAGG